MEKRGKGTQVRGEVEKKGREACKGVSLRIYMKLRGKRNVVKGEKRTQLRGGERREAGVKGSEGRRAKGS